MKQTIENTVVLKTPCLQANGHSDLQISWILCFQVAILRGKYRGSLCFYSSNPHMGKSPFCDVNIKDSVLLQLQSPQRANGHSIL